MLLNDSNVKYDFVTRQISTLKLELQSLFGRVYFIIKVIVSQW